jgi:glycyl-tRNA synthetase beta chain
VRASRRPDRLYLEGEGKAESLFLRRLARAARSRPGCRARSTTPLGPADSKVMQYQLADGWSTVQFVRPAHGLVALHGSEVVPVTALGLDAGRVTQGHRFEAKRPRIELRDAGSYAGQLRDEGAVIAGFAERRRRDRPPARRRGRRRRAGRARRRRAARRGDGAGRAAERARLRVRSRVPRGPGRVPGPDDEGEPEVLSAARPAGALTHRFLLVSNIAPADPSRVIEGNERVVRPRLADAKFFFDQDRRTTLASRVAGLDRVVYHGKLGSQGERVRRVQAIAGALAAASGASAELAGQADRAARSPRPTCVTDMVGEFPELQGTMGRYYALNDGEDGEVAVAIEDHYRPRFAGDELPRNPPARWSPSPTSWRRWSACSRSTSCPPATRIRSPCAAMRSACCAS